MTAAIKKQMTNFTEYVAAFLTRVSDEGLESAAAMIDLWKSDEIQAEVKAMISKDRPKKLKDPNKPKRARSAYQYYCDKHRAAAKEKLGADAKLQDVSKALGEGWQDLKTSVKKADKAEDKAEFQKHHEAAAEDKERYATEMESYDPPSDEELADRKKKKKKDPNHPKRGKNAYLFFCGDNRDVVKSAMSESAPKDVTKELGARWTALKKSKKKNDKETVKKYQDLAEKDKVRYETEMENYTPSTSDSESDTAKKVPKSRKSRVASKQPQECSEETDDDEIATKVKPKRKKVAKKISRLHVVSRFCEGRPGDRVSGRHTADDHGNDRERLASAR